MPSQYCNQNPNSAVCSFNPNYGNFPSVGVNVPVITAGDVNTILNTGGVNIPTMSTTPMVYPKNTPTTTLDKSIAAALSAIALLTRQGSIPTVQNQQGYGYTDPLVLQALANQQIGAGGYGGNNGVVEKGLAWVKNNSGVAAIGAGAIFLYFLQPSKPLRR